MSKHNEKTLPDGYQTADTLSKESSLQGKEVLGKLVAEEVIASVEDDAATALQAPLKPPHTLDDGPFRIMFNGPELNKVVGTSYKYSKHKLDEEFDRLSFEGKAGTTLTLTNVSELLAPLRGSAWKLLDAFTLKLSEVNNFVGRKSKKTVPNSDLSCEVVMKIEDYMKMCKIPLNPSNKKKVTRTIKQDLITLRYLGFDEDNDLDYEFWNFVSRGAVRNGYIRIKFEDDFVRYLATSFAMQYNVNLLGVDGRNPNAFPLGRKLNLHASINQDINEGKQSILSVENALKACDAIPSYEKVRNENRAYTERIIKPLEKALNALSETAGLRWNWANSKGVLLTDEQLKNIDYDTLASLYISYYFIDEGLPAEEEEQRLNQ